MNARKSFIVSILFISSFHVFGQTQILSDFKETVPPKYGSDEWFKLNHSEYEFKVALQNGQLIVNKETEIQNCELKIPKGRLIGINRGEWGGRLTFAPNDTKSKEIEIKTGNIKFIFSYKGKIYFIEGLAHLSLSEGFMYELDITNEKFTYKKVIDFEDAPKAYTIYGDKILIASHKNFYIIKNLKKELVFKETFWSSLYPNSIAVLDDRNIFLGIRSGYVKLDILVKKIKFYKYKK
jgi:hypothetical protein